ncbi:MAG TPA: hypothetical protein ENO25_03640 [Desulfobacteraceae bacterium]|nr:hypothetical protein [Desulfobacteraceae bacterium]
MLSGKASYYRESRNFVFKGRFAALGINGRVNISQHRDMIDAEIRTERFFDLAGALEQLPVDRDAVSWVRENITARDYLINNLHLGFTVTEGRVHVRPVSMYGSGTASEAMIRFHPSLAPVRSTRVDVSLENDRLSFELDSPVYKAKNLDGSRVTIAPLLGGNTRLAITLQTESPLDSEIHELLKTYDIKLPLTQQTGTTRGNLQLLFDLPGFTLHTRGTFATDEGSWTWGNIPFSSGAAEVRLENDRVIIDNAELSWRDVIRADLTGTIDTTARQAALSTAITRLDFPEGGREIVRAAGLSTPVNIDFSDEEVKINLPELMAEIALDPSRKLLVLRDLNRVKAYLAPIRDFPFQEGKVNIDFTDPDNLAFDGFISTTVLPLSLDDKPVNHFTFRGDRTTTKLSASINQGKISLTATDRLHIALHDYLVTVDTDRFGTKAGTSSPVPLFITGPRSLIRLQDLSIPTAAFQAELNGKEVTFTAALDPGKILFEAKDSGMTLAASDIDAMIAQDFFRFADLEGGKFDLSVEGKDEKNYEGFVEFSDVLIKDAKLLNNILSFINAIPALATLSSPGFDSDGYSVTQGIAHFARSNDLLTIQQFRTDGTTINTEAEGWVDLENDILKIDLKLISLKDYSRIISKIPWAGYAILGEDGSLSTSLILSGSRHEPDITTNLPAEIVMMPINIVKRVIQWPFRLFGRIKDSAEETPETGE